ncbi:MAG: 50S ribosomal protein L24 [Candidatus Diapherotrites archaeon]|nr:50S ribosomal protein L24 [Candidatus Diapherotrites archaeon]
MRVKSSKPKKQRKAYYSRKLHELGKELSVHLGKELRKQLGKRAAKARVGDKVRVMRGKFRGKEGKIVRVNRQKKQVFLEGITRKKAGGRELFIPFRGSNLLMLEVSKDERRVKGKNMGGKKEEKPAEKKEQKGE